MSSIDNRVVQMQFNNREFEAGIQESLKSIEELNAVLLTIGKINYGDGIAVEFASINDAIEQTNTKFNALEEIAIGVFRNIGDKIAETATDLLESFTIAPLAEGYSKYESQITKTAGLINAATFQGYEDPEDVVIRSLEKIQWYADATSYSYDSMVSALLAFVNSNVPLEEAVDAIMGIGNSFSYAGAVATEVSPAFAVLSKSMGSSAVMYKSVINSLQNTYHVLSPQVIQSYLDTAEALGYLEKEEDHYLTTSKAFDKGISKQKGGKRVSADALNTVTGWLNGEVLQSVYKSYGSYAEAVYQVQQSAQEAADGGVVLLSDAMAEVDRQMQEGLITIDEVSRTAFLSAQEAVAWSVAVDAVRDAVSSTWKSVIQDVLGDYTEAKKLFTSIQDYLIEVFTTPVAAMHATLSEWKRLGGRDALLAGLGNLIKSATNIVNAIKSIFAEVFPPKSAEQIVAMTQTFKEFTDKLFVSEEAALKVAGGFKWIAEIIKFVIDIFKAGIKVINSLWTAVKPMAQMFAYAFHLIASGVGKVFSLVNSLNIFDNMATQLTYKFTDMKKKIAAWYASFTDGKSVFEAVTEALTGIKFTVGDVETTLDNLKLYLKDLWDYIQETYVTKLIAIKNSIVSTVVDCVTKVIGAISTGINWVRDNFDRLFERIKTIWTTIRTTVEKGVTSIGNFVKKLFASANEVVGKSGNLFSQYMDKMYTGETRIERLMNVLKTFLKLVKQIFNIEIVKEIAKIVKGLRKTPNVIKEFVAPLQELTNALKTMTKSIKASVIKKIALSVLLLAASMVILSIIPAEKMGDVFGYMVQMLIMISILVLVINRSSDNFTKASKTVVAMGVAILLITIAMMKLTALASDANFGQAFGALLGMFTMLLIMVAALGKMTAEKSAIGSAGDVGLMLLKLASGVLIIANAMKILGGLNENQLLYGVAAIFAVMVSMAMFIKAMSVIDGDDLGSKTKAAGTALILLSVGMIFMAGAVSIFGNMKWETVAQGLIAVMVVLMSLAYLSQQVVNNQKQLFALAGSLFIISMSLIAMAAGIALLGNIKPAPLILGVSTLFITLAILTTIANKVDSKSLLTVSAAVGVLGLSLIAFAAGLMALGMVPILMLVKGLIAFSVVFMILVAAAPLIEAAGTGFIKFAAGALLLGVAMIAIAAGITALSAALLLIDGEVLATKIAELISGICAAIVASADSIIHAVFSLIAAVIAGLGEGFGQILSSLDTALNSILSGICNIIGIEYPGSIAASIGALFGFLWNKFKTEWGPAIWQWLGNAATKFVNWLGTSIKNLASKAWTWIKELLQGLKDKITNKFTEIKDTFINAGKNIITGLKTGITDAIKNTGVYKTISELGDKLKNVFNKSIDAHSPSKVFQKSGSYIVQGLVKGIKDNASDAADASGALGLTTIESLKDAISGSITDGIDTDLTLTPVLDLSQIEAGTAEMSDMLDMDSLSTTVGTMGNIQSSDYATANQIAGLTTALGSYTATGSTSQMDIATSIKEALNGVGVYADSKKIGKLVTIYQANTSRAGGY